MAKKYFKLQGGSIWGPKACKTNAIPLDHRDFTKDVATIKLKIEIRTSHSEFISQYTSSSTGFKKFEILQFL